MTRRLTNGFTLIELMIVIAIMAVIVAILLPSLTQARNRAKVVKTHIDLRSITTAIELYKQDHRQSIPPTHFSCNYRTAYELPVDLASYLPAGHQDGRAIIHLSDAFTPEAGYLYRAVGRAIMNESTLLENAATLWVEDGFPHGSGETGRYYNDPETSPVKYAVWSMGPDPVSSKFDIPGRLPIPRRYWLKDAAGAGVIVHFEDAFGRIHVSP